jgi:hypothetical protein
MPGAPSVYVYQFKIVLRRVSPVVWRRLLLRSDHSLADLHYAIQISMGWSDSHLHLFHIHGKDYSVAHEGGIFFSNDPKQIRLADFEFRLGERFLYEYDFYDHWEHDVRLERCCHGTLGAFFRLAAEGIGWRRRKIVEGRRRIWNRATRVGRSGGTPFPGRN